MLESVFTSNPTYNISNGNYKQIALGSAYRQRLFDMQLDNYLIKGYFYSITEITCSGGFVKLSNGKYIPATSSADAEGMVYYSDLADNNNMTNKNVVVANKFKNGQAVSVVLLNNNAPLDPYILCAGAKKDDKIALTGGDLNCKVASTGETAFAVALADANTDGAVPVRFINKEVIG